MKELENERARAAKERRTTDRTTTGRRTSSKSAFDKALGSAATSIGRSVGNQLVRGILGALFK
ncbi:hypothetical protein SDC9_160720 [bioreactor metagenome]|uniref:Uncharacterized protein n=1 Tax=bioreactor metagenome TaxID=1076179 RepID=A0A645FJ80_9ZZZZ